jgi:hypothetical protein
MLVMGFLHQATDTTRVTNKTMYMKGKENRASEVNNDLHNFTGMEA